MRNTSTIFHKQKMATGDGPLLKKLKIKDKNDEIFMSFHKDHLKLLEDALVLLQSSLSGYGVGIVKITICNALSSKCFSSATCDCEPLRKQGEGYSEGFKIRGIFQYGFNMLEAYLQSPECTPQRRGPRLALAKLLMFLSDRGMVKNYLS